MDGKFEALVLAPEAPYPAVGGGPLRTAAIVEYLARRAALDVIVFREAGAPDPRGGRLSELARHIKVIELPVHSRARWARLVRNLRRCLQGVPPLVDRFAGFEKQIAAGLEGRRYRLAVVEHFWCAPYGRLLRRFAERLVLDLHNVESVWHERASRVELWPISVMHRRFAAGCRRLERFWLPRFWRVLVASGADATQVRGIAAATKACVYPNTIPYREAPRRSEQEAVIFTGNLEYLPNVAAVRDFAREIWPRLKERRPGLEWWLAGKRPEVVARYVAGADGVRVWGEVEDAVELLARAKVAVVPVQSGSGTRVKILEAWAATTPVVSTSLGAEGLGAIAGQHLLIADTPGEFVEAILRLLECGDLRTRIGEAGRSLYEREYIWEAGWRRLDQCLSPDEL